MLLSRLKQRISTQHEDLPMCTATGKCQIGNSKLITNIYIYIYVYMCVYVCIYIYIYIYDYVYSKLMFVSLSLSIYIYICILFWSIQSPNTYSEAEPAPFTNPPLRILPPRARLRSGPVAVVVVVVVVLVTEVVAAVVVVVVVAWNMIRYNMI